MFGQVPLSWRIASCTNIQFGMVSMARCPSSNAVSQHVWAAYFFFCTTNTLLLLLPNSTQDLKPWGRKGWGLVLMLGYVELNVWEKWVKQVLVQKCHGYIHLVRKVENDQQELIIPHVDCIPHVFAPGSKVALFSAWGVPLLRCGNPLRMVALDHFSLCCSFTLWGDHSWVQ